MSIVNNSDTYREKVSLPPLPIWKWMIIVFILLTIPVTTLIQQALETFRVSADMAREAVATEVESVVARVAAEMHTTLQLREIIREYYRLWKAHKQANHILREFVEINPVPLPYNYAIALNISRSMLAARLDQLKKQLRNGVYGIKLYEWNRNFKPVAESDASTPAWVFQYLLESIKSRIENRDTGDRSYLNRIPFLQRYFGEHAAIAQFLKFGSEFMEFSTVSGEKHLIYWDYERIEGHFNPREHIGGFIALINLEKLPAAYGLKMLLKRKSHEWKDSGVSVGWVFRNRQEKENLPYPFPSYQSLAWSDWVTGKPDGHYEKDEISLATRSSANGLTLVAAKSIKDIDSNYRRKVFWLFLFIIICLALPCFIVICFRSNNGMGISIRWQILSLFFLAIALPFAAIVLLGNELLRDRQKTYENNAYNILEKVKKDIEKNTSFAFRHLEEHSNNLCHEIAQMPMDNKGNILEEEKAASIIRSRRDLLEHSHFYLMNSYGDMILHVSSRENSREGTGLIPLVQSLSKVKLRFSGNLRSAGKLGEISMMDLLVETTGGAGHEDVRKILNDRENRAFELKLSDRRTVFFLGEYYPESRPEEAHIMVILIRDVDFEKLLMRLMIEKLCEDERYKDKLQLFFGMTRFNRKNYFYPAGIEKPWFDFLVQTKDTQTIGGLSEPTRFDGLPVKDSVFIEATNKKCLFYSFSPAGLERTMMVALYDYAPIDAELSRIRIFLLVSFLVSLIVVYILARIMSRSLIEPVNILTTGVRMVESGNYSVQIELPGKDELVELSDAFNLMASGLDERERMTRYLSKSAVEAVVRKEDGIMGGKRVPATILFSDIRSFTTISESNDAETVVALLNEYFAIMNAVIEKHGGDIDKFIGDAIMAQFIAGPERLQARASALNAVRCGLKMMESLQSFNDRRIAKGMFPIGIGVGINSGEVISGNIGSPGRMDHTVIGDTVNVASRLEGMSKSGRHTHIIISRATLDLLQEEIVVEKLSETSVKGKLSAVEMFEVIGLK